MREIQLKCLDCGQVVSPKISVPNAFLMRGACVCPECLEKKMNDFESLKKQHEQLKANFQEIWKTMGKYSDTLRREGML